MADVVHRRVSTCSVAFAHIFSPPLVLTLEPSVSFFLFSTAATRGYFCGLVFQRSCLREFTSYVFAVQRLSCFCRFAVGRAIN